MIYTSDLSPYSMRKITMITEAPASKTKTTAARIILRLFSVGRKNSYRIKELTLALLFIMLMSTMRATANRTSMAIAIQN